MAIQEFEPRPQTEPQITLLRELAEGQDSVYHFFVDGQDSHLTISREQEGETQLDFTYHFRYYDWEYGQADVHCNPDAAAIEWQGLPSGLKDELEAIQADRFMQGASPFLLEALKTDFPGMPVEDAAGNIIYHL
jgi:hypothetical protein